jgi:hypothetical protein
MKICWRDKRKKWDGETEETHTLSYATSARMTILGQSLSLA